MSADEDNNEYQKLVLTQRLKAAIHYTVGRICEQCEQEANVNYSKEAIAAISETAFRYSQTIARDLELFAKHAKRTTITNEDVLLLVRRNPSLTAHMRTFASELNAAKEERDSKKKDRKKKTATVDATDCDVFDVEAEDSNL